MQHPEDRSIAVASDMAGRPVFRCPACHAPLMLNTGLVHVKCEDCHAEIPVVEGIPLLVRDRQAVERVIHDANMMPSRPGAGRGMRHHKPTCGMDLIATISKGGWPLWNVCSARMQNRRRVR